MMSEYHKPTLVIDENGDILFTSPGYIYDDENDIRIGEKGPAILATNLHELEDLSDYHIVHEIYELEDLYNAYDLHEEFGDIDIDYQWCLDYSDESSVY